MNEILILYVLTHRDLTMYAIQQRIVELFGAYTFPSFGSIKPALVKLEKNNFVTGSKIISDGGKVSIFYSITKDGIKELKKLLLLPLSKNPVQYYTEARIRISCMDILANDEKEDLLVGIKSSGLFHKLAAEKIMKDEYTTKTPIQKIMLDNTICEYKNFINLVEGLDK